MKHSIFVIIALLAIASISLAAADEGYSAPSGNYIVVDPYKAWITHEVQAQNNYDREFGDRYIYTDLNGPDVDNGALIPTRVYVKADGNFVQKTGPLTSVSWPTTSGWRSMVNFYVSPQGFGYFPNKWKTKSTNQRQWPFQGTFKFVVEFNNMALTPAIPVLQVSRDTTYDIPSPDITLTKGDIRLNWPLVRLP